MPKVVDPEQRRERIFEALFDVVIESGIEHASLRRVADAAGLALGSVRHYFGSRDELISSAATALTDRISTRLEHHRDRLTEASDHVAVAEDMLAELLPLDATTSREVALVLEIVVAAMTDPALRGPADQLLYGSHALSRIVVGRSNVPPEDVEIETERLAALIDGLALRATAQSGGLHRDRARSVLRRHLEQLRSDRTS